MSFVADFETTTDPNDCRVWAYAICDINEPDKINIGINIGLNFQINRIILLNIFYKTRCTLPVWSIESVNNNKDLNFNNNANTC